MVSIQTVSGCRDASGYESLLLLEGTHVRDPEPVTPATVHWMPCPGL